MDELTTRTTQLPDTLEDLSQFVLVNKAKLDAYRVKLRAVNRLSDAQEIREQTFQEAQEVANALIAAEARIGEILLSIPKNTSYHGNQHQEVTSNGVENAKNKSEVTEEMGYTRHEVSDYQRIAQNPAVVNLVLEQAERDGKIVSHAQVMKKIKEKDAEIERLSRNNDTLDRVNKRLAKEANQGGKIIEKTVEVEVVPDDYEELKKRVSNYEGKEASKKFDEFIASANVFMIRYKDGWSFDNWNGIPGKTRDQFVKSVKEMAELTKRLEKQIEEL